MPEGFQCVVCYIAVSHQNKKRPGRGWIEQSLARCRKCRRSRVDLTSPGGADDPPTRALSRLDWMLDACSVLSAVTGEDFRSSAFSVVQNKNAPLDFQRGASN